MKFILTLFLILFSSVVFGQIKYPGRQDVEEIIKLTISQKMTDKNPACEYGQCGEWWAANKDSLFFKSDTIRLYNSSNIVYNDTNFCTSFVWDFCNSNSFNETKAQMCQEPPTRTIKGSGFLGQDKVRVPNKYDVISQNDRTFIAILVDTAIFETYEVIGLQKTVQKNLGDKSYMLTLVRQK